jgi:hypothetical protein
MRKALIVIAVFALASVAQAADNPQKPGRWRITVKTEMRGMEVDLPPMTFESCITGEDVKDPKRAVPRDPKDPCEPKDTKIEGNEVFWSVDCPKTKVSGKGHIVFSAESYNGEFKVKIGDQEMIQRYSGKWMGACTK